MSSVPIVFRPAESLTVAPSRLPQYIEWTHAHKYLNLYFYLYCYLVHHVFLIILSELIWSANFDVSMYVLHYFTLILSEPMRIIPQYLYLMLYINFFYQLILMVFSIELITLVQEPLSEICRVKSCALHIVLSAESPVFMIYICNFCSMPTIHITLLPQCSLLIFFLWCYHSLFATLSYSSAHIKWDHISSHIIGFVKIPWKWGKFEEGPLFVDTPIPTYN